MTGKEPQDETDCAEREKHGEGTENGEGAEDEREKVDEWDRLAVVMVHP